MPSGEAVLSQLESAVSAIAVACPCSSGRLCAAFAEALFHFKFAGEDISCRTERGSSLSLFRFTPNHGASFSEGKQQAAHFAPIALPIADEAGSISRLKELFAALS